MCQLGAIIVDLRSRLSKKSLVADLFNVLPEFEEAL
jgi:hypothetical protein